VKRLRLSEHAYKRLCERVGEFPRLYMERLLNIAYAAGAFDITDHKKRIVSIAGTHFGYEEVTEDFLVLTTCLGDVVYDLDDKWFRKNRDSAKFYGEEKR
jgi:hypothetical protein